MNTFLLAYGPRRAWWSAVNFCGIAFIGRIKSNRKRVCCCRDCQARWKYLSVKSNLILHCKQHAYVSTTSLAILYLANSAELCGFACSHINPICYLLIYRFLVDVGIFSVSVFLVFKHSESSFELIMIKPKERYTPLFHYSKRCKLISY